MSQEVTMVNRNMKKYSSSLVVMEMKIKLTIRNDFTLLRLAKKLKIVKINCWQEYGKGILSYIEGGKMKYLAFEGSSLSIFITLKLDIPFNLAISFLGIYLKE